MQRRCAAVKSFLGKFGTEPVMMAIQAARAFTGRPSIARFEGAYHGSYDFAAVGTSVKSALAAGEQPAALPHALGTPDAEVFHSYEGAEETAIILLHDAAAVRACAPDMAALRAISLMAIVTAPGDGEADVVSRVFVPAWGVDEDPVTGSAHAALAPFGDKAMWLRELADLIVQRKA